MLNGTRPASLDAINALQLSKHFSVSVAFAALLPFSENLFTTVLLRIAVNKTHLQSSAELLLSTLTGIQH